MTRCATTLSWLGVIALGTIGVSFAPPAVVEGPTLTLFPVKPVYASGEEVCFTVHGRPNTFTILGADPDPGPTIFHYGTVNLGLSPELIKFTGFSDGDGDFVICCIVDCDHPLFGRTVYLQGVQFPVGGTPRISNAATVLWDDVNGVCPSTANLCPGGGRKPATITMQYTGEDCSATSNSQEPGKVSCSGDPASAPLVHIISHDPPDKYTWFAGDVALGGSFVLDAGNASRTQLQGDTIIDIYDASTGALLQTVQFHTSCSQPLIVGDQFGACELQSLTLTP